MKRNLIYSMIGLVIFAGYSCTENIDIEFKTTEERLVVNASLTDESKAHEVLLMRINLNPDDSIVTGLTGATVTINDGNVITTLSESDKKVGLYVTPDDFAGIPGKTYTLQVTGVEVNGKGINEIYSASATMPQPLTIDSVTSEYMKSWKSWVLQCWAYDPPSTNYYMFKAWRNGVCVSDSLF